jgi:hypothetical protein
VAKNARICEIWQMELTASEKEKLQHSLDSVSRCKTTQYDYAFDLHNGNLYCSEFLYALFRSTDPKKFGFVVSKNKLHYPVNLLFQKDSIAFIPVDFFKTNAHFSPVKWD